ncbi:hypothetical protein [Aeromonas hydrophila]|uniref:hypothetical protein n=1 Tax=Aeromonas hydrophila TaxID=644 RepID=UPI001A210441|nr:hypothetical protein [Aeromonas hydrophila]HAT2580693.1 hypothetical protein [Aeromonas hydrophila]HAT2639207.1 hypothetical protein [Aeromonas hydrophila]HAT3424408.1 hypothetical protein [Aeromonas hydrophila]HAT3534391.1 hypothetical protein [Aeromonas hydrophila]
MEEKEGKAITIADEIKVGPTLAILLTVYFVLAGDISWHLLLVVLLWSLDGSIIINWRKLFRRRS